MAALKTQGCTSHREGLIGRPVHTAFATAVQTRDGGKCRFSGMDHPLYLQKTHIIPHSKAFDTSHLSIRCTFEVDPILLSKYVERMVNPRASSDADRVTDSDDVRNGILLNSILHAAQGAGDLSFLRVCSRT